jgi:hypothetical protein
MSSRLTAAAGILAAAVLVTAVAACSGSPGTAATSSVTCTNFPVNGTGSFHDEVEVQVTVSNNSSTPANYVADVAMTLAGVAGAATHVSVSGLVAAGTSGTLSRKVLAAGKARGCTISQLSRS